LFGGFDAAAPLVSLRQFGNLAAYAAEFEHGFCYIACFL
jgi:hypothetical protein